MRKWRTDGEAEIFRRANRVHSTAGGLGGAGSRCPPAAKAQRSHVLHLEEEVRLPARERVAPALLHWRRLNLKDITDYFSQRASGKLLSDLLLEAAFSDTSKYQMLAPTRWVYSVISIAVKCGIYSRTVRWLIRDDKVWILTPFVTMDRLVGHFGLRTYNEKVIATKPDGANSHV